MQIERTDKEIIIKISAKIDSADLNKILEDIDSIERSALIKDSSNESAFGAWEGNETPEELAKLIRDSRTLNRQIEELALESKSTWWKENRHRFVK